MDDDVDDLLLWDLLLVKIAYHFHYEIDYLRSLSIDDLALFEAYLDAIAKVDEHRANKAKRR